MAMFIDFDRGDYLNDGIAPRQRRVHILRWNPTISSFTREGFEFYMTHYKGNIPIDPDDPFDWSVWNWQEVMHRDLFVMMQVGQEVNGIVWGGFLGGYPYQYKKKDGSLTKSFYFETAVEYMHRIEKTGLMTVDRLMDAVPGVDWLHGHSGEMLSIENAEKLGLFMVNELKDAEENDDVYFDSYNQKKYVLADILTFMCPDLKKRLLEQGKNKSPKITDINNLMVCIEDENYVEWDNWEDHLSLEMLNGIMM
ncbi:MAG: hypothetical protein J5548_03240 [Prevotella sp.]|nr:hypothetical protein [Prevotella sp.]